MHFLYEWGASNLTPLSLLLALNIFLSLARCSVALVVTQGVIIYIYIYIHANWGVIILYHIHISLDYHIYHIVFITNAFLHTAGREMGCGVWTGHRS